MICNGEDGDVQIALPLPPFKEDPPSACTHQRQAPQPKHLPFVAVPPRPLFLCVPVPSETHTGTPASVPISLPAER